MDSFTDLKGSENVIQVLFPRHNIAKDEPELPGVEPAVTAPVFLSAPDEALAALIFYAQQGWDGGNRAQKALARFQAPAGIESAQGGASTT